MSLIRKIFGETARKFFFHRSGYNQYGLFYDDMLYETPEVLEAIRRLPSNLRDERSYRIVRAMQLAVEHSILPKEQWTKYEEDVRYLQPYLKEVVAEKEEKEQWNKSH